MGRRLSASGDRGAGRADILLTISDPAQHDAAAHPQQTTHLRFGSHRYSEPDRDIAAPRSGVGVIGIGSHVEGVAGYLIDPVGQQLAYRRIANVAAGHR